MSQHRSQQEWLRLVQKYYNGEQSAAQFCLEHNLHPKTFDNNRRKLQHLVNMPKKREDSLSEFVVVEKTAKLNTKTEQQPATTLPTELRLEAGACSLHIPRDVTPQWTGLLLKELAVV
ncbi:transposase [Vibrio crassostreae]|nr:transposase [Vibrio crassostreae]CAK2530200.1 transposase [Vibrio crassostreae]CAK3118287.1 transposase [Vibrio crassostreae]CAK3640515.1 transposase [Vibrio crassostreae]CAK3863720.1 transposase [Vibrio crassostreae]